jgi:CDP-6-deoxy-D-xylo-4-hexulose-3-dehydrase
MYFGHHLSTIEGGFINTNNEDFYYLLLMMRSHGWDRDLPKEKQEELRKKYKVSEFDSLYNFYVPGFNLRSTDLQAFIGLRSIDKLDEYSKVRNLNFKSYNKFITVNELDITEKEGDFVSNFALPIVSKNKKEIINNLIYNGIETRPLIAGDMSKKPMWYERFGHVYLPNCEKINEFGFYVPNHQDLTVEQIKFISKVINNG